MTLNKKAHYRNKRITNHFAAYFAYNDLDQRLTKPCASFRGHIFDAGEEGQRHWTPAKIYIYWRGERLRGRMDEGKESRTVVGKM